MNGPQETLLAAQREICVGLHHAGVLKALSEGRLPMDLLEENDVLQIHASALLDSLLAMHQLLNDPRVEGLCKSDSTN